MISPNSMMLVVEAEAEHAILVEELREKLSMTHVYNCKCDECLHVRRKYEELSKPLDIDSCPEEFLAAHIRFHLNRRKGS
jgi:hypothetical protein